MSYISKKNCKPLARNDVNARSHLAKSLNLMYGPLIYRRESTDTRPIIKDQMPRERLALVIHKRFYITNAVNLLNNPANLCVEVTLVREGMVEHDLYAKVLFTTDSVMKMIWRSKANIVGSQLLNVSKGDNEIISV